MVSICHCFVTLIRQRHFKPIICLRRPTFFPNLPAAVKGCGGPVRMNYLSILPLSRTCVFLASIVFVGSNASRWIESPSGLQETRSVPVNPKPIAPPGPSDARACQKEKCLRGGKESPAGHKTKDPVSRKHRVRLTWPSRAATVNRA